MPWTETTRKHHERQFARYSRDMTDDAWAVIAPLLPGRNIELSGPIVLSGPRGKRGDAGTDAPDRPAVMQYPFYEARQMVRHLRREG